MQDKNDSDTPWQQLVMVRDLRPSKPFKVHVEPSADLRAAMAEYLGILEIRKMRFSGMISSEGKSDWKFTGELGATVVQSCVVSLAPVTTRIDEEVTRYFVSDWNYSDDEDEVEMSTDDTVEPLGSQIDIGAIMVEALAIALPDYPRSPDAILEKTTFSAPGVKPMSDEDAKPFAGLAELKKHMQNDAE